MYGWRGRIGFISPAPIDSVAYEFYKMVPEGVVLVSTCLKLQKLTEENIVRAQESTLEAAQDLADAGAQYIIAGATPTVTSKGVGHDKIIIDQIQKNTGVPATTTITAAVDSLNALGAKRLAVATPYKENLALHSRLKNFLEGSGFEVVAITTMDRGSNYELSLVPAYTVYQHAKKTYLQNTNVDVIYIPCARWAAVQVIEQLENDLNIPVVTALQAMIWAGLYGLNIKEKVHGYGKLMRL